MKISNYNDWNMNEKDSTYAVGQILAVYVDDIKSNPSDTFQLLFNRSWVKFRVDDRYEGTFASYSYGGTTLYSNHTKLLKDYPIFFITVKKVGIKWVEGTVILENCDLIAERIPTSLRFDKKRVSLTPGKFFQYIEDLTKETIPDKRFFDKNDAAMMTATGEKAENPAGSYYYAGVNYSLSEKLKAPVIAIEEQSKNKASFFIRALEFIRRSENLSPEKLLVIANECSKYIGAEVRVVPETSSFEIPWFTVKSGDVKGKNTPFSKRGEFGPFFTVEQAEKQIETLKEAAKSQRLPFDVETLEVDECPDHSNYELTFAQLIEYVKTFGIDIELQEFLEKHRGFVAAKKFGF